MGEDLTLTIRARTRSTDPIGVVLPGLTGFTIVGSREVSEVTIEGVGGPVRTTTRELQLRAGRIGPVVYASSIAVYGPNGTIGGDDPPGTLYGVYKRANEGTAQRYFEDYGVSSIGLRPKILVV